MKAALLHAESARFSFAVEGCSITRNITRAEFEGWIAEDLGRLDEAITTVLSRAGLEAGGVDRVFLTGGTSHVPAVRACSSAASEKARWRDGRRADLDCQGPRPDRGARGCRALGRYSGAVSHLSLSAVSGRK